MSNWKRTAFAQRLDLQLPIIQGPFGGGLSSVDLAAAVCEGGGLGSFGAHHLSAAQIEQTADAIRARTKRAFALNLWMPFQDSDNPPLSDADFARTVEVFTPYFRELGVPLPARPLRFSPPFAEQIEGIFAARPAVFSFVFGVPSAEILERCRKLDIVTLGAATTVDEAVALAAAGVDMIVASGFEAGGHRVSFLRSAQDSLTGTFALIPQVVDAVDVPVIAAGGIADARGVAAALTLGAHGAQIGTAFLACKESAASQAHRQKLFSADAKRTALTRAYSGRLARGIENRFMHEWKDRQSDIAIYPVQNWFSAQLKAAANAQGRDDLISLWSGQGAPLLRHHDARSLLRALDDETSRIFDTRAAT
jgi:nitronate monooxygenase